MIRTLLAIAALAVASGAHAAPLPCQPQSLTNANAIRARVILVGELHGTKEMPAFVAGLACSLLQVGRPVALSLEVPADAQPALDRYLASDGGQAVREPLLAGPFGKLGDGRGSEAYMALIEQVRLLRSAGAPVTLAATDITATQAVTKPGEQWDPNVRDRIMADNIAALTRSKPAVTVVSLSGNLHATQKKGGMLGAAYEPLGYVLAQRMPVHSIAFAHRGGTAWVCLMGDDGKQDCGTHKMGAQGGHAVAGYNSVVRLGPISASARLSGAGLPCKAQDKIDVMAIKPQVILLGELRHGTAEMPAFAAEMACALLQDGRQVLLALEVPADRQELIERYLDSQGSEADKARLRASEFGELVDGRSSHAMLALLEQARRMRAAGARLSVVAADTNWKTDYNRPLMDFRAESEFAEKIQAENILALARKYPEATVLGLYGAAHTSLVKGESVAKDFEPMAYRVAAQLPVYSIALNHAGGDAWYCKSGAGGGENCAAHALGAGVLQGLQVSAAVELGRITASAPMRQ